MTKLGDLLIDNLTEMNLLWLKCKLCNEPHVVPYDQTMYLPECPHCNQDTEWIYSKQQVDDLKERNKNDNQN